VSLSLVVQYACASSSSLPVRAQVRRWALATHTLAQESLRLKLLDSEVTVRYIDEKEGRELNTRFRGKDYATNVLTFVRAPFPHPSRTPRETLSAGGGRIKPQVHADIAICAAVVTREAKAQKKSAHCHHAHMVVHGLLHALGFDHEHAADAEVMEALEQRILLRFRINDPYAIV
jgi:probable rRNA maturation factor